MDSSDRKEVELMKVNDGLIWEYREVRVALKNLSGLGKYQLPK